MATSQTDFLGVYTLSELYRYYNIDVDDNTSTTGGSLKDVEVFPGSKKYTQIPSKERPIKSIFTLSEHHQLYHISRQTLNRGLKYEYVWLVHGYYNYNTPRTRFSNNWFIRAFQLETSTVASQLSWGNGNMTRGFCASFADLDSFRGICIGGASVGNMLDYGPSPLKNPYNQTVPGWTYRSSSESFSFYITGSASRIPTAHLTQPRGFCSGLSTSGKGYCIGGYYQTTAYTYPASMSDINKFTYSTDTLTTLSNKMPHSRDSMGAAGNYSGKGYLMGGVNSVSGTYYSNTQKVTYSTDTGGNAPTASSYTAMIDIGAGSDYAKNYAYFVGGATGATYLSASFPNGSYSLPFPNTVSTIQKVAYSTDTRTTLSQKLSAAPLYGSGTLETQYNECFGTSVVPGDRKGVGVAPGKNYLFIHGGGSYDSCTYGGYVRTFEWHWSEIELMSYATDTMIYLHTNFSTPNYNEKASHTALAAL